MERHGARFEIQEGAQALTESLGSCEEQVGVLNEKGRREKVGYGHRYVAPFVFLSERAVDHTPGRSSRGDENVAVSEIGFEAETLAEGWVSLSHEGHEAFLSYSGLHQIGAQGERSPHDEVDFSPSESFG